MKVNVLFARFPFGGSEHPSTTDWLVKTVLKAKADPRVGEVFHLTVDDTPITMGRNRVLKKAQEVRADYVLMVDSDMRPDLPVPGSRPFWDSSFDFALRQSRPCVVAAPYCGPPPHENVYVFRWSALQGDNPNADLRLEQFTREEACQRAGFEEVAALPTGLCLIAVDALDRIDPPWFEYEWEDPPFNTRKATTEDVFFTRNLSLAGVPQLVNWDAWAGHYKTKCVGKPHVLTSDCVRQQFREAVLRNQHADEKMIMVNEGLESNTPAPPANGRVAVH